MSKDYEQSQNDVEKRKENKGMEKCLVPQWQQKKDPSLRDFQVRKGKIEFKVRISLLDDLVNNSSIRTSFFFGFFTLAQMFVAYFYFCYLVIRYQTQGTLVDWRLYQTAKQDFIYVIGTWPLFILWAHSAWLLQQLILRGLSRKLEIVLQHSTQAIIVLGALFIAFFG